MKNNRIHIGYQLLAWTLILCLVLPIAVKFTHILSDHEHEVCSVENQFHFHEIDMDCEFYNFNINHITTIEFHNYDIHKLNETLNSESTYYSFLKSHNQLTSRLRGPPALT